MNKRIKNPFTILIAVSILIFCLIVNVFSSQTVVGVWYGDNTFDIVGVYAPFEFATKLEFEADGTLTVTTENDISTYRYSTTDDTITIQGESASWGVYYELKGESLNIKTGKNFSVFTKEPTNKK